jgi:hypothetical protein
VDTAADRQVMGVVAGWAVFSLRAVCAKKGAAPTDRAMLPLLDKLIVPEGISGLTLRDPVVLYLLARQQYGGLTAVLSEALTAFCLAQAHLSSMLTKEDIATHGAAAFNIAVDHVRSCEAVRLAFDGLFEDDCTDTLQQAVVTRLLAKFFNQAGAEFRSQVESIWNDKDAKTGVGIRTELKVLQKKSAATIESMINFDAEKALALPPLDLHRLLLLVCGTAGEEKKVLRACRKSHLQLLLRAYVEDDKKVSTSGTNEELWKRLVSLLKKREGEGPARPALLPGGGTSGGEGGREGVAAAPADADADASASADASAVAAAAAPKSPARLRPQPLATRSPNVMHDA